MIATSTLVQIGNHDGRNKTRLVYVCMDSLVKGFLLSSQTLSLFALCIESTGGRTVPPPTSGSGSVSGTDTASFDTARKTTAHTEFYTENRHLLLFASFKRAKQGL